LKRVKPEEGKMIKTKAFWAAPRRLHRMLQRAFTYEKRPLTTAELARFAYPRIKRISKYHLWAVRRSMAAFGVEPIKRTPGKAHLWWWEYPANKQNRDDQQ
jgi:hypothetical protein